jgi:hypothetical protein
MAGTTNASRQRGAAALVVTALLFFAMLLVVAAANRAVLVEAGSSANQYKSTQAFEAAEAGLEWTLARLNDDTRLDDECLPSESAGATSFRDRHLRFDPATAALTPVTWNDGAVAVPLQAACVHGDAGWACSCPGNGVPSLPAVAGAATAPGFAVSLLPGAKPGLVVVVATGCSHGSSLCAASASAPHEAAARVEVALGLVPALRAAPAAALTARGDVDAGSATLGLHNLDAGSGGTAVDAGGQVSGTALRLSAPPGSSLDATIVAGDSALSGLDDGRFFKRWYGMDAALWLAQPATKRIVAGGDCADAVVAAVAQGYRMIGVDGDLSIEGPVTLGTPELPVVIAVSGALRLSGAVTVNGLVSAASLDWNDAASGASIRGAALIDGNYGGNAAADFIHDAQMLARLRGGYGSFARVDGSWKDF